MPLIRQPADQILANPYKDKSGGPYTYWLNKDAFAQPAVGTQKPKQVATANSYIDRVSPYGIGGDPNDFARKQMAHGFRRGGITATQAAHANARRAPQAKLPSER